MSTFYQFYKAMTPKYAEHFKFKALVGVVETYGGTYGNEPGLIKAQLTTQRVVVADLNNPNLAKLAKALEVRCEEYFSCMILFSSFFSKELCGSSQFFDLVRPAWLTATAVQLLSNIVDARSFAALLGGRLSGQV